MLLAAAGFLVSGNGSAASSPRPNLLLLTVDTLRPDALGWTGGLNATPELDRLAAEGFRFPGAISPVPLTLPAHVSILTGVVPRRHGVHDNGQVFGARQISLLSEILQREGWTTAAFVSGYPLESIFGLDRGFDHYDDRMPEGQEGWVERRAPATTAAAIAWLRQAPQPWFVWVHYYDPHDPYEPPRAFWNPGPRGAYDGEVMAVDSAIGALMRELGQIVTSPIVSVFAADHGEALGEHGEKTHGYFIYDSTLRVPLVFHAPHAIEPGESAQPARLVDIVPTVLDLLDLPVPGAIDGQTLLPLISGRPYEPPLALVETQLPWVYFGWAPLQGVRSHRYKLIDAPRPELYDLVRDPKELSNQYGDEMELREELHAGLKTATASSEGPTAAAVDDEAILEKLRALGYVEAGGRTGKAEHDLPDPKDRIGLRELLLAGERALRENRLSEALSVFEQALQQEPDNRLAVLRSGVALLKLGRSAAAVERLERAVGLDAERAEARFALGDALMRGGRYQDAVTHWKKLVELQPRRAEAWANLGIALLHSRSSPGAADALARASQLKPDEVRFLIDLGRAELAEGNASAARAALDRAEQIEPASAHWPEVLQLREGIGAYRN